MKEIVTEITIDAPAERVWDVLTDFERFNTWNPFIQSIDGEIKEGKSLRVFIVPPGMKGMTFKPTVTHVVPRQAFRWRGRLLLPGLFDGAHSFEIHPRAEKSVRFVQRERFSGILVPLLRKSLDTNTRQGFNAMNAALKKRAEER